MYHPLPRGRLVVYDEEAGIWLGPVPVDGVEDPFAASCFTFLAEIDLMTFAVHGVHAVRSVDFQGGFPPKIVSSYQKQIPRRQELHK
jgi:hypothetical protein